MTVATEKALISRSLLGSGFTLCMFECVYMYVFVCNDDCIDSCENVLMSLTMEGLLKYLYVRAQNSWMVLYHVRAVES